MRGVCLIPNTGDSDEAAKSAEAFGWEVITYNDEFRCGSNPTRNLLFALAKQTDYDFVRYCDHDDRILAITPEECIKGINYFDYRYTDQSRSFDMILGDPNNALSSVGPWSWIADMDTLKQVEAQYGSLWDESIPCRQGSWMWIRFLTMKLKFNHIRKVAYHWMKSLNGVSSHPDRKIQDELIRSFKCTL